MSEILSAYDHKGQTSRRQFLERFSGAASLMLFPSLALGPEGKGVPTPASGEFWGIVKNQFILRDGLILMNAANLCPAPVVVMEAVFAGLRDEDQDASFQNRDKYTDLRESSRAKLAQLLGASADEIAIVRNTTEANNTVVRALELKAGDEVLLWDQNHPTNSVSWKVRAAHEGFTVKYVTLPMPPGSADEVLETFRKGFTSRTKVVSFSQVSNHNGTMLPAKELCAMAHERGVTAHVDGAQTFGVMNINLHEIGCDSYSGSAHKWFMGPKEAGVLYVRQERINDYRAAIVGAGWGDDVVSSAKGARKFECFGQRNDATLAAVGRAVDFHNSIGEAAIESRVRELATALKEGISSIPGARLYTSKDPSLCLGVVFFDLGDALNYEKAYSRLYEQYGLACALFKGRNPQLRICPHIYNTLEEVDKVVGALRSIATSA
jgi:selenocysteine lyase/cysteine desulfurase